MKREIIRLNEVDSTNDYLRRHGSVTDEDMTVVVADHQTSGRGQGTNTWESEDGKNLLLSILVRPWHTPTAFQFLLSMTGALALKDTLDAYTEGITLKWPNDVYWNDRKISGTLIETSLSRGHLKGCIFGIGLNINQLQFVSDAPNPVSLAGILGHEVDREEVLQQLLDNFERRYELLERGGAADISANYYMSLYRHEGFHPYEDADGRFEACIVEVGDNGTIVLRDSEGRFREYTFKEVRFIT
uniref:Biotin--[acetyl-CoA-carboxylase] ligase n=1 Tax=Prevotella sp. GTC17260 TaxID=3236796 RepID=A0AB33JAV3_9BACT